MKRPHESDNSDSDEKQVSFINCGNSASELQMFSVEPPSGGGLRLRRRSMWNHFRGWIEIKKKKGKKRQD